MGAGKRPVGTRTEMRAETGNGAQAEASAETEASATMKTSKKEEGEVRSKSAGENKTTHRDYRAR
jgi:hypothetical protein